MRIPHRSLALFPGLLVAAAAVLAAVTASSAPDTPLPQLRGADIPSEKSAPPKLKDWAAGTRIRPHRRSGGPCKYTVVREWLRIECDGLIGGTLVAGDPTDVTLVAGGGPWIEPDPNDPTTFQDGLAKTKPAAKTLITLRIQRGETKIFSLLAAYAGYFPTPFEMGYVSVSWPAHREDPLLLTSMGEL